MKNQRTGTTASAFLTCILLFTSHFLFAQAPTISSIAPTFAATGETVTINGSNFTGVTGVKFGGTAAASFTVVSATRITAVVAAGTSGSVTVSKSGYSDVSIAGFTYSSFPSVTGIITDFGSYWNTNTTSNNSVYPNDSHNLLSFTYNGITYSTGVNDATLSNKGVPYTVGTFKALPAILNGTSIGGSLYIVAASKVDGNTAAALYTHPNIKNLTIENVLSDGPNGLNLGTGYTNLPTGATSNFVIKSILPEKISDNEPDIVITQIADPSGTATDTYKFLDASGNIVGNSISQDISKLPPLGTYYLDLFTVSSGVSFSIAKPTGVGSGGTNTTRQIRFIAFRLSDFGITAANYSQIRTLQVIPSGVTDVAFVAYNALAINVPPSVAQNTVTSNTTICASGGGSAYLAVNATAAAGGVLSYSWELSTDGGTTWNPVSNGGVYSGATTNALSVSAATAGYKYRTTVTEASTGYSSVSGVFTIATAAGSALAGTLNPSNLTLCLNAVTGTTYMSVTPTGGTGTYNYQWSVATTSNGTYTSIPGANYNTYSPPLNVAGTLYYKVLISSGCYSNLSNAATVTINGQEILSVTNGTTCTTGTVALSATASGGTVNWYAAASGGTVLSGGANTSNYTTPSIAATTTYYVSTTASSCESPRMPVVASVLNTVTLTSSNFNLVNATSVCAGSGSLVTVATSALLDGTYTVNYNVTGANTTSGTASMTMTSGSGTFTIAALSTAGVNTITVTGVVMNGCTITPSSGNTVVCNVNNGAPDASDFSLTVTDGCSNNNSDVTIRSRSLSTGTYIVTYSVSGTNTLSSTTAQVVFTAGAPGSGTFSLPVFANHGASNVVTITSVALLSSPTCNSVLNISSAAFASNASPIVEVGSNFTACGASAITITNSASATNYSALSWSSSNGTGVFANNTTGQALSATTYTPSVADITRGTVYMTITATANSGCSDISKTYTLSLTAAPVGGTAASDQTIVYNQQPANLTVSGYSGTIVKWQKASDASFNSPVDIPSSASATLSGATIGNLTSTTYFRMVVQNGVCGTTYSSTATVTVVLLPTITSFTPASGTVGITVTITGTNLTGATAVTFNGTNAQSYTVVNATTITAVVAAGSTTGPVRVTTPSGTAVSGTDFTVLPYSWTGNTSQGWNTSNNWSPSGVPAPGADIIIPGGLTNYPVLDQPRTYGNVSIASGGKMVLNGQTVTIQGTISGNGVFTGGGNSSVVFTGSGDVGTLYMDQTTPGTTNTIKDLTINRSSNARMGLGNTLRVTGTVTPVAGTLETNGNLVLVSTSSGTASIAASATCEYIIGTVTVQRYVGATRQWRMIGFPFTKETTVTAASMNLFYNSGAYAAYTYNENADDGLYGNNNGMNAGWTSFTGVATTTANNGFLLVGGPKSTIQFSGPLNTCDVQIPLSYTVGKVNNGWNLVSNPFASNLNWTTIAANNPGLDAAVYRYDPAIPLYASYVNGVSTGKQSQVIENGAAFFVHSTGVTSMSIRESDKTQMVPGGTMMRVGANNSGNRVEAIAYGDTKSIIKLTFQKQGEAYGDEVALRWGGGDPATDLFDRRYDAYDMGRSGGTDASVTDADSIAYSIYHGTELRNSFDENRQITLRLKNISAGTYQVKMDVLSAIANGNKVYLYDRYAKTYTQLDDGSTPDHSKLYTFTITTDSLSKDPYRFAITFKTNVVTAVSNPSLLEKRVILLNNPSSAGAGFMIQSKNSFRKLNWQMIDNTGRIVRTGEFSNIAAGQTMVLQPTGTSTGVYMIRITADGVVLPMLKAVKE